MPFSTITRRITPEIKRAILRSIAEALNDPDFGLELSEKAKKRLKEARKPGRKLISAEEIKRKYY